MMLDAISKALNDCMLTLTMPKQALKQLK